MPSTSRRPRVLILLHQPHSTPGRVGCLLAARGASLDIRRPLCGDALPDTVENYDAAAVFGGPMSAREARMAPEIKWLEKLLAADKPLLGICLGAQMLAKALGAAVFRGAQERCEIGYYPIEPTPAGDALCGVPFPRQVYQWHEDGFQLPRGAQLLARGDENFPNQAFAHGAALGLQFHPDCTLATIQRWADKNPDSLARPGARARDSHVADWAEYDGAVAGWLRPFVTRWLAGAMAKPSAIRAA